MRKRNVGVIGGGPAGCTVALLLAKQGCQVTIFERAVKPKPVGAGIMLQPTGLATLRLLNLEDQIKKNGLPINGIHSVDLKGREIFNLSLHLNGVPGAYGVHRTSLFTNLYQAVYSNEAIQIHSGQEIADIQKKAVTSQTTLITTNKEAFSGFDLIIVADGRGSLVRKQFSSLIKVAKRDQYLALWAKLDRTDYQLNNKINHVYDGTKTMYGLMPIGYEDNEHIGTEKVNFFYGAHESFLKEWTPQ